jgi:5-methyltetrahydrofolate--homocysteine methyltransferase
MAIDFNHERWQEVKKNSCSWWDGKLGRPLIQMILTGRDPGRPEPRLKHVAKEITSYDLQVTPDDIVDNWDYYLSGLEFLGDAFPRIWPDFGAGVLASFMGALPEAGNGTVWFHPDKDREIKDLHFELDLKNVWLGRVKKIIKTAMERWGGLVQVGMTDLGGNLDVLSTFRPGEKLLMDLVDFPDEVKRLAWEEHKAWWKAFEDINSVLKPRNPGYTAWSPIFSETPYYMLQCDFCYMIGPAMFDEFVKPELEASCKKLDHAFYHLDGVGQLPHLDSLLSIKELKGVQWVPGAGKEQGEAWPEVYHKIIKAGKRAQFVGSWRKFDKLVEKVGGAENFVIFGYATQEERPEVENFLKRHGAA